EWLYEQRIPGLCNIDTRELTKKLRINGVMMGAISTWPAQEGVAANSEVEVQERLSVLMKKQTYVQQNFIPEVSTRIPHVYGDNARDSLVLLDTGTKNSIIRNILRIGFKVVCLPWDSSFEEVMSHNPMGVVISNGPGDPKVCKNVIKTACDLISASVPTLGICLGNQILALAAGANTYKLKFGHRGQNKPCIDLRSNRTYITSQNHGYGIEPKSLNGTGFKVWFSNVDDQTVEGIEHEYRPIIAVQFHPEASPGPYDCIFVFDRFKELLDDFNRKTSSARITETNNENNNPRVKISAAKKKLLKRRKFAKT
ncbi:MAG TPA: carbamoyl phosphate synthase small subunit, partial [Candidatus Nitrosopolaris sp.]|nr:carbamoyl phosphate synthase small subunit [Candidatus Nitrosopolaris sp.]